MQSSWQPTNGQAVVACKAIAFGGGVSPWLGKKGIVKKLLSARACLVLLEGDTEAMLFFHRELDPLEQGC